jgi:hypothetical protein
VRHKLIAALGVAAAAGAAGTGVAVAINHGPGAAAHGTRHHSSRCPKALQPGRQAYFSVARAVRREVPRVFPNRPRYHFSNHGYRVWGALSLAQRGTPDTSGFPRAQLLRKASRACGAQVADRSWVVAIDFPGAPAVTLATYVTYLARTKSGWRFWYDWLPYAGPRAQGFLPEHVPRPAN